MASAISLAIGASGCMSKTDQAIATAKENKVITGMRVNGDLIVSDGAMILPEDTVEGLIQVEALGHRNDPDSLAKHYLDHTS
jgi:hypothetical protein